MSKDIHNSTSRVHDTHTSGGTSSRSPVSVRTLLTTLFRQKWKIFLTFLVLSTAGFAYLAKMPVLYRSEAKLFVRSEAPSGLQAGVDPATLVQNELALLDSYLLSEAAVQVVGLHRVLELLPAETIEAAIAAPGQNPETVASGIVNDAVSTERTGDVIGVTCTLSDPVMAHELLGVYLDGYWERRVEVQSSAPSPDTFREKSEELRDELDERQAALTEFRAEFDLSSATQQQSSYQRRVDELDLALSDNRVSQSTSDARVRSLTKALEERGANVSDGSIRVENPEVAKLRDRLLELQLQEIELDSRYVNSKELRGVRMQIGTLREAMAKLPKTVSRTVAPVQRQGNDLEDRLQAERVNAAGLEASAASMQTELEQARVRLSKIDEHESTLAMMTREVEHLSDSYWQYRDSLEAAELAAALERESAGNVSVLQPPSFPTAPIAPNRERAAVIILGGALLLGFLVAGCAQYLDDTIADRHDIEHALNIPVLATVSAKEFKKCI